jgi:hypothetical protein
MRIKYVKNFTPKERFLYWIDERYNIKVKRDNGEPKPWTDDEILQSYRFCNVRRMDDKVSQWLLNKWYDKDSPTSIVACAVARHFNLPSALVYIPCPPSDWSEVYDWCTDAKFALLKMFKEGKTIYNSAYMISGGSCGGQKVKYDTKVEGIFEAVIKPFVTDRMKSKKPALPTQSMQTGVQMMTSYKGFASFMAGQVIADYRHVMSGEWADRLTYAPIGPGSCRGLNRLLGRTVKKTGISQEMFNHHLKPLVEEVRQTHPQLEAMDVQNCLCEFDKYCRVLLDESEGGKKKKPKAKYPGV